MDTDCAGFLSQTGYGLFYLLAGRHDQVGIFINHHNYIRHEAMTLVAAQFAGKEFLIVLLNGSYAGSFQQLITVVHFHAERVESRYHLCRNIGDDGIVFARHTRQIMFLNG